MKSKTFVPPRPARPSDYASASPTRRSFLAGVLSAAIAVPAVASITPDHDETEEILRQFMAWFKRQSPQRKRDVLLYLQDIHAARGGL
jgi:hypothetical protein